MNTTTRSPKARDINPAMHYSIRDPNTGQFVKISFGLSLADLLRLRAGAGDSEITGVLGDYAGRIFFEWAEKFFSSDEIMVNNE